jgi:hypothetical protein
MRRTHLRGQKNILKRLLIHVGAFNLGFARAHDVGSRETTGVEKPACFGLFFLFFGLLDGFPRLKTQKTLRFQSDDRRHTKIVAISDICCAIRTNGGSATAC